MFGPMGDSHTESPSSNAIRCSVGHGHILTTCITHNRASLYCGQRRLFHLHIHVRIYISVGVGYEFIYPLELSTS